MTLSSQQALLLNADFSPMKVVGWKQAISLVLEGKSDLVCAYEGKWIRSASRSFPWPAVIRLVKFTKAKVRMRLNRLNVLARDGYRCAYCGLEPKTFSGKPDLRRLTLDHVVPRAQASDGIVRLRSGKLKSLNCWENVVAACRDCNGRKADRTPEQARMPLLEFPRVPNRSDVLQICLRKTHIQPEWEVFL